MLYTFDSNSLYLCAECQLIAQSRHVILQQVNKTLKEGIVLTFHVCISVGHIQKYSLD